MRTVVLLLSKRQSVFDQVSIFRSSGCTRAYSVMCKFERCALRDDFRIRRFGYTASRPFCAGVATSDTSRSGDLRGQVARPFVD
jgi:hypothetical protein